MMSGGGAFILENYSKPDKTGGNPQVPAILLPLPSLRLELQECVCGCLACYHVGAGKCVVLMIVQDLLKTELSLEHSQIIIETESYVFKGGLEFSM